MQEGAWSFKDVKNGIARNEKSYKKKKVNQLFWTCKSPIFSYAIFHFQPFPREPSFLEEKETARSIPYIFYRSKLSNYLIYYCCIQTLNNIDVWLDINTRFIRIIQLTNWIAYIYFNNVIRQLTHTFKIILLYDIVD